MLFLAKASFHPVISPNKKLLHVRLKFFANTFSDYSDVTTKGSIVNYSLIMIIYMIQIYTSI